WMSPGGFDRAATSLQIQRSTDGGAYELIATVTNPKRRHGMDDKPGAAGTYSYQARLVGDSASTPWSDPVSVTTSANGDTPGGGTTNPGGGNVTDCPSGYTDSVIIQVNALRASYGARDLNANDKLGAAAQAHSIQMAETGSMDHDNALQEILDAG